MPAGTPRPILAGARFCASCALAFSVWSMWLALLLLFSFQVYIASVNELRVPRFLLHAIEDHLARSGLSVAFGRATFDPSGRVLLTKARFKLASFSEPVVTADAIYIRLDPLALLEGRFEAREIRATGANLYIPAMLSASGLAERVVQDLDAGFSITSRGDEFSVDYLNCRMGGVFVSAHGQINAGTVARNGAQATSLPLAEFLSKNYVVLSRELTGAEEQMAGLDGAVLTANLTPSDTRGALVGAELFAEGLRMSVPIAVEARGIRAVCRFPLLGGAPLMTSSVATAERIRFAEKAEATGFRARARGILKMDTDALKFDLKQLELTAGSVTFEGATFTSPMANVIPGSGRTMGIEVSAALYGRRITAGGDVDLAAKSADISFDGMVAPPALDPISAHTGFDIRRFFAPTEPIEAAGRVRFSPGWKFADVTGRVNARNFAAYHVNFEEARGTVSFDGTHFAARRATAVSGDNRATGSYEQNFSTQEFRYLLTGRLRPLDISAWFLGDWWPNIFKNFGFPTRPPDATIDVRGRYFRGRTFSVFGYAEATDPVLRGVPFSALRALLYVDQSACDGLEVSVARGTGSSQGSFRLTTEPTQGTWSALDVDATSSIDPSPLAKMLPAEGASAIAAFSFEQAPAIALRGHFDGPAAEGARHKALHTEVRSEAGLRVHGVIFDRGSFKLDLVDDVIDISSIEAGFAGGSLTGTAHVSGTGADRRLRLKASLAGASLGQAAEAAKGYVVAPTQGSSTALDMFSKDKSGVRLDLSASAEGRLGELGTFVGDGNVQIQGAKLGELSLLGGLSKVLKFPELRFTQARASFKIENSSINFPDLSVIGANSAIQGKGTYAIDRRMLDFTATIYPFMESKSILQLFNAISAPISAVFRVRLTGSIDKPAWRLAYSPLNLLREGETKAPAEDKLAPPTLLANPPP
jgi:hypothetical protein